MVANREGGLPTSDEVLDALRASQRGPLRVKELAKALGVTTSRYKAFRRLLRSMEDGGHVYRVKGKRYAIPEKVNLVVV